MLNIVLAFFIGANFAAIGDHFLPSSSTNDQVALNAIALVLLTFVLITRVVKRKMD